MKKLQHLLVGGLILGFLFSLQGFLQIQTSVASYPPGHSPYPSYSPHPSGSPYHSPSPYAAVLSIGISQPGAACLVQGSSFQIQWTVSGNTAALDHFTLNYWEGGQLRQAISPWLGAGNRTFHWMVPASGNTPSAQIKIEAWSSSDSPLGQTFSPSFSVRSSCNSSQQAPPSPTPSGYPSASPSPHPSASSWPVTSTGVPATAGTPLYVSGFGLTSRPDARKVVGISFNRPTNPATVSNANVYLYPANNPLTRLESDLEKSGNHINIVANLNLNTSYTASVRQVRDTSGNVMAGDYSCTFIWTGATLTACPTGAPPMYPQPISTTSITPLPSATSAPRLSPLPRISPTSSPAVTPYPVPSPRTATPTKIITARVARDDGTAVSNAMGGVWQRESGRGYPLTNLGDGTYRITVTGGVWNVMIGPQDAQLAGWDYRQGPQVVTFTNDTNPESREVAFRVARTSANIRGKIIKPDGSAPSRGSVGISQTLGTGLERDGSFTLAVPAGTLTLTIFIDDPSLAAPELAPLTIAAGERKDLGTITLVSRQERITGKVASREGVGLPNIPVHAFAPNERRFSRTVTDASGNYVLPVTVGAWMVQAEPYPESNYVNPRPPVPVTVARGVPAGVDFVLTFSDGTLEGTVVDEEGALLPNFYGFVIVSGPNMPSAGGPASQGRFSFRLQAGSYTVRLGVSPGSAVAPGEPILVTLRPGERKNVTLRATPNTSEIRGAIKDETGALLRELRLRIAATGREGSWQEGSYDPATGNYHIRVAAGRWGVRLAVESGSAYTPVESASFELNVAAGSILQRDIVLRRAGATVRGVVTKPDGSPFASAFVTLKKQRQTATSQERLPEFGAETNTEGRFSLNIPTGSYLIQAFAPPALGYLNPEAERIEAVDGEVRDAVLRFRRPSVTLSGRVLQADRGARAFVVARSEKNGYAETESSDDGRYTLTITPDENWRVSAHQARNVEFFRASETTIRTDRDTVTHDIVLLPLPRKLPETVSMAADPVDVNVVGLQEGLKLTIPPNAIPAAGKVTITITPDQRITNQSGQSVVGNVYGVEMRGQDAKAIDAFNADIIVQVAYTPSEVSALGARPEDLALSFWDERSATWKRLETSAVNTETKTVSAAVGHLTRFALIAPADTQPPNPPANVSVETRTNGFRLSWVNPADTDFHHVKIYRSATRGTLGTLIHDNLTGTTKDDVFTRESGRTYYYVVRAIDLAGNESRNTTQYTIAGPAQAPSAEERGVGPESAAQPPREEPPAAQRHPNGTLLRTEHDGKIWIVNDGFRRHLVRQQIPGFYEHLKQAPIITVSQEELNRYRLAAWVRYVNSPKVYEINDDGTKHWLDMTPEDFLATGRRWEGVFLINKAEIDFYQTGPNVRIAR